MIYKNESKHRLYEQDDKLRCALGKRQIIKYVCSEASIYMGGEFIISLKLQLQVIWCQLLCVI